MWNKKQSPGDSRSFAGKAAITVTSKVGKKTATDCTLVWILEMTVIEGCTGSGEVHVAKISVPGSSQQ